MYYKKRMSVVLVRVAELAILAVDVCLHSLLELVGTRLAVLTKHTTIHLSNFEHSDVSLQKS